MTTTREAALEAALKKISAGIENPAMFARVTLGNNTKILPLPATEAQPAADTRVEVKPLTFDEIVTIVENTEVSEMTANGDKRWTRRMAEMLHRKQFSAPITPATSDKIAGKGE